MEFKVIEPMTMYVLIGGVLVIFIGLGLRQLETLQKSVPLWLWSGIAGIVVGAGSAAVAVYCMNSSRAAQSASDSSTVRNSPPPPMGGPLAAPGGGGGGGGRGGAPGGGGAGGPGGGGGGGGGPRSRRELATLVGKLAMLTGGVQIKLDAEQKGKLASAIEAMDKDEEMTDEVAKEHLDAIKAILTSDNAEVLASIELPRAAPGGGGPGGQGPATVRAVAPVGGGASTGASGGAAGGTPSDENPFKQEENARRLNRLREHVTSQ